MMRKFLQIKSYSDDDDVQQGPPTYVKQCWLLGTN